MLRIARTDDHAFSDRFMVWPSIIAMLIGSGTFICLVVAPLGGLIPPPSLLLLAIGLLGALFAWFLTLLMFAFDRLWKRAGSVFVSPAVAAAFIAIWVPLNEPVRIWIARCQIDWQLSNTTKGEVPVTRLSREIWSSDDAWLNFFYDPSDEDAPDAGKQVKAWTSYAWTVSGCRVSAHSYGHHFYTELVTCP